MSKKIITSRKGRKCKAYGCKHLLSVYNHDSYCHVHSDISIRNKEAKKLKNKN